MTAAEGTARWQAVEQVREALPPADHDPPCGFGRCAPHAALSLLEQLAEAAERLPVRDLDIERALAANCPDYGSEGCECGMHATPFIDCPVLAHRALASLEALEARVMTVRALAAAVRSGRAGA